MEIRHIFDEKHTFLPLLLLGDEQEDMIARYLGRSDLFALYDGGILRTVCAVTDEGCHTFEIKIWLHPQRARGAATAPRW